MNKSSMSDNGRYSPNKLPARTYNHTRKNTMNTSLGYQDYHHYPSGNKSITNHSLSQSSHKGDDEFIGLEP